MNNRFRHGKQHFEWERSSPLAPAKSGMQFEKLVLDPEIGAEAVLILAETTPFAYELQRRKPFQLYLTSGAARTSLGPVLFLLWWVPPVIEGKPFALYEHILNPTYAKTLAALREIAEQTHLHLILIGPGDDLLDVYEFENFFQIGNLVPICERACMDYPGMDFAAAKEEYESSYELMELFREGQSRT